MTNNSAAGWVVQLSISGTTTEGSPWRGAPLAGPPTFKFFNVAVPSAEKAIEVARKAAGESPEAAMTAIRKLSPSEIASIELRSGEAKPA
jgi:hypothetical protein